MAKKRFEKAITYEITYCVKFTNKKGVTIDIVTP
jgi:hypothetical protein